MNDDKVNSPSHYCNKGPIYEPIKVLKAWMTREQFEGFLLGNSLKYLSRYRSKNGIEDLQKASWYLTYLINELKEIENANKPA